MTHRAFPADLPTQRTMKRPMLKPSPTMQPAAHQRRLPRFWPAVGLLVLLAQGTLAIGQESKPTASDANQPAIKRREPTRFLRVRYDEYQTPVALQTATAKYVLKGEGGENRLEVFLESVVHVGDRTYFRGFNKRFQQYDVVLYELVSPPDQRIPNPQDGANHPLRLIQQTAAHGLGFAHQIDEVNYRAKNLVHSDLTIDQLRAATKKRGDDEFTVLMEMMVDVMRRMNRDLESQPAVPSEAGEGEGTAAKRGESEVVFDLAVFSDPDGAVKLRRMLAAALGGNAALEEMLHPSQLATLIRARNDRAMEVFQEQVDVGHDRIAFFWGAGHMEDFERRLILEYGLQPEGVVWRDAWDLRDGAVVQSPLEAVLEKSLRGSLGEAIEEFLTPLQPARER